MVADSREVGVCEAIRRVSMRPLELERPLLQAPGRVAVGEQSDVGTTGPLATGRDGDCGARALPECTLRALLAGLPSPPGLSDRGSRDRRSRDGTVPCRTGSL